MGKKMHRVVIYKLDLDDPMPEKELKYLLENIKYVDFTKVMDIRTADIGEWDDDHELNKRDTPASAYERYFPELSASPQVQNNDLVKLRDEKNLVDLENNNLKYKIQELKKELNQYKEISELVKKIKNS